MKTFQDFIRVPNVQIFSLLGNNARVPTPIFGLIYRVLLERWLHRASVAAVALTVLSTVCVKFLKVLNLFNRSSYAIVIMISQPTLFYSVTNIYLESTRMWSSFYSK